MNKTRRLLLLTSSCLVVFICLNNVYAQNSPDELYAECVRVAGESYCDFLFRKDSAVNPTNLTATIPSNYTESTNSTNLSNSTYLTYKDDDLGFRVKYPSDWTPYSDNDPNFIIGFAAPENTATVDVRVLPKGKYGSLKEYGDLFKEETTLLAYYRNSSTLLSGKPAFKALYLTTSSPSILENAYGYEPTTSKALFIATMVPERESIYGVAYISIPSDFDFYRPVFEKMIDTFQIYGKGPIIQEDNSSSSVP